MSMALENASHRLPRREVTSTRAERSTASRRPTAITPGSYLAVPEGGLPQRFRFVRLELLYHKAAECLGSFVFAGWRHDFSPAKHQRASHDQLATYSNTLQTARLNPFSSG
jgi:hypothetical protein